MDQKFKILVVDDEENVLSSVKKVISSKFPHYYVELVSSPSEALEKINDVKYDLIITDLMMPGIDGLELIKKIREIDPELKIIMMTGYATMKTALLAMREGASKYISKPFTREELITAVNAVLLNEAE
jgi:DNA-binding NtrC family response regulator